MKIRSLILFVLAAVVCGAFLCADSQAKVCFLGEDCGSGGNFSNANNIDPDDMCVKAGYILKTDCEADSTMHAAGYCPFSGKYVTCCSKEYAYSKCAYPLKSVDVCGNKHKCVCDEKKYPYYQTTINNTPTCVDSVEGTHYSNGIASGGTCAYPKYDSGVFVNKIMFSKCSCDRGLYPKAAEDCKNIGSQTTGSECTDSEGHTYYAACLCSDKFKVIASDCKYGIYPGADICQQGDVLKVEECCVCPEGTYPYDSTNLPKEVETTTSCEDTTGCSRGGSRVRATSCKKGWEVKNGECVPVSCSDAVKIFLETNTGYGLLTPNGLVDAKGNLITSGTKVAIVADDIEVKQGKNNTTSTTKCEKCSSGTCAPYGSMTNHYKWDGSSRASSCICLDSRCDNPNGYGCGECMSYNSCYCNMGTFYCSAVSTKTADCTTTTTTNSYKGIASAPADVYYSVPYLLATNSWSNASEGVAALERSCKGTPTLTYSSNGAFPVDEKQSSASTTPLKMYGINLKTWSSMWFYRPVEIYNGNIEVGSSLYTYGKTVLKREKSYPNGDKNLLVDASGLKIYGGFKSTGYDYELYPKSEHFGLEVDNVKKYSDTFTESYVSNDYNGPGDNVVQISGMSSSDKTTVNVGHLYVRGIMSFKYAEINPLRTVVGSLSTNCSSSIYGAFLTLYYSNLNLYDSTNATTRKLTNCANSGVGYPDLSGNYTFRSSYGSNIVTQKSTYYGVLYKNRAHKSNGETFIKFVNYNGSITTNTSYHYYTSETHCSFWGCNKGHTYRPTNCTIDGYGNTTVSNCQKNGDDGCDTATYFAR